MKKKEENENKENNTKNLTLQRLRGDSGFFKEMVRRNKIGIQRCYPCGVLKES